MIKEETIELTLEDIGFLLQGFPLQVGEEGDDILISCFDTKARAGYPSGITSQRGKEILSGIETGKIPSTVPLQAPKSPVSG